MKAQFWSIDMIFSIILLTTVIAILSVVWVSVSSQYSLAYGYAIGSMQAQLSAMMQLLQTQGVPQNWNTAIPANSISGTNFTIGLMSSNGGTVSSGKLAALSAMSGSNYQAVKQHLGIAYDYYIIVSIPNQYNMTIGSNPFTNNAVAVQSATLPITLDNGEAGSMRVMVWTNTSFGVG